MNFMSENFWIIANILVLTGIALAAAAVLYFVSKKFAVKENPKIDNVEAMLPGVNCGACGKAGCRDFANACVKASNEEFAHLFCPVGGKTTMQKVAEFLGFTVGTREATVAVLRCQGTCENAPDKIVYSGLKSCRLASRVSVGKSGCPNGCMRFGDCTRVCKFDALHIGENGIPVVDESKCTSCGACVKICPRSLYELRAKNDGKRVFVACRNVQKAQFARKNCKTACIGCGRCTAISSLIKVENNLSYIPASVDAKEFGDALAKCCPTKAIVYTGGER